MHTDLGLCFLLVVVLVHSGKSWGRVSCQLYIARWGWEILAWVQLEIYSSRLLSQELQITVIFEKAGDGFSD